MNTPLVRFLFTALTLILLAGTALAADLVVVSSAPMEPGLQQLAQTFKETTGQDVKVMQGLGQADITRIITMGEPFDVLVATTALVDSAVNNKRVDTATRVAAGKVGIGVLVRSGSTAPDISSADSLKQAALAADGLVYNTAGSGQAVQRMFDAMGIAAQIQPKAARPGSAAQTMDRVLQGKGVEIGFGLISEIKPYEAKGVRYVGPLPAAVQSYINYEALASASSTMAEAARSFLRYITTPAAKQVFTSTGVD